jgi:protein-S-isoprenylcysteine O-methyltransferase Ste14
MPLDTTTLPSSAVSLRLAFLSLFGFLSSLSYGLSQNWHTHAVLWISLLGLVIPALAIELFNNRSELVIRKKYLKQHHFRLKIKRIGLMSILGLWGIALYAVPYFHPYGLTLIKITLYPLVVLSKTHMNGGVILLAMIAWIMSINYYLSYTDQRLEDPYDGLFQLGAWIVRKKDNVNYKILKQFMLQWIIKAFFFSLLLSWLEGNISELQHRSWNTLYAGLMDCIRQHNLSIFLLHEWGLVKLLLFTIDLAFGTVGYIMTLKLLNTHIRSADPTLSGWVICLMCYPPFNQATGNFSGFNDSIDFVQGWANHPIFCEIWAIGILSILTIYCFATVQFGIRFSNLTHRGIITNGLYGLTKHPAYVSKNIMWWMTTIPYLMQAPVSEALIQGIHLIVSNFIYYYRAKTEEKHLSQDPIYQEYILWMQQHSLVARLSKRLSKTPHEKKRP